MAQAQAMLMKIMQTAQGVLPPGIQPQTALYAVVGVGMVLSYLVGVPRAGVFIASVGGALVVVLPAARGGGGVLAVARRAVGALGERIASQVANPYVNISSTIGAAMLIPMVAVVLFFCFSPLFLARAAGTAFGGAAGSSGLDAAIDQAYMLGFQDATNDAAFGTNRPTAPTGFAAPSAAAAAGGFLANFGFSQLISVVIIGNALYPLGKVITLLNLLPLLGLLVKTANPINPTINTL
jgi:hypothetical protein